MTPPADRLARLSPEELLRLVDDLQGQLIKANTALDAAEALAMVLIEMRDWCLEDVRGRMRNEPMADTAQRALVAFRAAMEG